VAKTAPELQRRGIFRRTYEGTTLREHFGLPRQDTAFSGHDESRARSLTACNTLQKSFVAEPFVAS
jgi:hypothetical protein